MAESGARCEIILGQESFLSLSLSLSLFLLCVQLASGKSDPLCESAHGGPNDGLRSAECLALHPALRALPENGHQVPEGMWKGGESAEESQKEQESKTGRKEGR